MMPSNSYQNRRKVIPRPQVCQTPLPPIMAPVDTLLDISADLSDTIGITSFSLSHSSVETVVTTPQTWTFEIEDPAIDSSTLEVTLRTQPENCDVKWTVVTTGEGGTTTTVYTAAPTGWDGNESWTSGDVPWSGGETPSGQVRLTIGDP